MKDISITYQLSDKEEKRLLKITEQYKLQGINMTVDETFKFIMTVGSVHDIENKFQLHEQLLALMNQK